MIKPVHDENGVTIYHSNSLFAMMGMPSDSVDSIVTDPPYGLSFMGKKWDYEVPSVQLWQEALRVLKPGGHLLSFAGSRTYHRMAVNIEDAGFEIRDQIMWIYGSGFPKSLDISKAIDKAAGVEREVVENPQAKKQTASIDTNDYGDYGHITHIQPIPATDAAKQWDGWGTALKPAHEPIVVARKPITGTVAENVLKHGTGGINIDGCRIEGIPPSVPQPEFDSPTGKIYNMKAGEGRNGDMSQSTKGRFPANIIFDAEAGAMLDKQSGDISTSKTMPHNNDMRGDEHHSSRDEVYAGGWKENKKERGFNDSGGASRFFYCAKASKQDRDEGLELMADVKTAAMQGNLTDSQRLSGKGEPIKTPLRANHHPTVKPTALMQYLVRLVTPPQGITLAANLQRNTYL